MKKLFAVAALVCCFGLVAYADETMMGTRADVKAMVQKAVVYYQTADSATALKTFSDRRQKWFHDRDLYVEVVDMTGRCLANGDDQLLIGMNLMELRDVDGFHFVADRIRIATVAGFGTQSYKWYNPVSGRIEEKIAYFEKTGNIIISCGASR